MSVFTRKIVAVDELAGIREELRRQGRVVVQCHGCFDIVHPGHIRYLRFAREQGDVLVVSVSGDDVVGKGADRPYVTEDLRAENLAALEVVDYVCIDHHSWAGPILERLRPDVYVKGKEYERSNDPRFAREKALVESYGGRVIFSSGDVVYSSTAILEQMRATLPLESERVRFFCRRGGVDRARIRALLGRLPELRVLVLGDAILDHYVYCESLGLAAESPVVTVKPVREEWFVGAGGLIARQVAALGARATFLSAFGGGPHEERFCRGLEEAGVEVVRIGVDPRPVHVKTRYLIEEQKVLKIDEGHYRPLSTSAARELTAALERLLADHHGCIVTDFGYGLLVSGLADALPGIAARCRRPYYADVSRGGNLLRLRRPRLAAPNEEELRFALGDRESGLSNLALRYYRETGAEHLVLTLAKRGVIYFHPPEPTGTRLRTDYLPALGGPPVDTVGAGDVLLAGMALGDLAGAGFAAGLYLGSALAAAHVRRLGNDPVDLPALETYLSGRPELDG